MVTSINIAKTVYGGDGIGRLGDGRVVFVPGAFAGEVVKAEVTGEKRRFARARLVSVEDPSPDRVGVGEPPVPGMVYANLSRRAEIAAKDDQLRNFFERARIEVEGPFEGPSGAPADVPPGYRNKVVYHFAKEGGEWKIGYRREPGHEIVDVFEDPLARPEINAKLPEVRRAVTTMLTQGAQAVRKSFERKENVTVRWTKRTGVRWWAGDAPADVMLREETCGRGFDVPADGFYQVNPEVGDELARTVAAEYAKGPATDLLVDLYCGVGVLGLTCVAFSSGARPRLVGVESGRSAVEAAKKNAAALGIDAKFFADAASNSLRRMRSLEGATVIVDPPRGGMEPQTARRLAASGAKRILCVSCDPATLMRDLRILAPAYAVKSVRWFDMFPRTARFETLAVLERRSRG
jgi:tRNA/tmRNA/rRNA uracil-C5-methylase (TrmA/RlmC/RlmD family)